MGNIQKRGPNIWRLEVTTGYTANKRIKERKTIKINDETILKSKKKTEDYLKKELMKFEALVLSNNYVTPEKMTFSKFVMEWREKYAKDSLAASTLSTYNRHINTRMLPYFGEMQIDSIKTLHILSFFKELDKENARKDGQNKPLEQGTIEYIHRVLKNLFSRATEWKIISHNPMDGVPKPKPKDPRQKLLEQKNNPQFYDEIEAQIVVDVLYKESRKWRLLILGSMFGGFRRGELLALEWKNINFDENTINIENNIPITIDGQAMEKGPKSIASYRSVDMPEWYMEEMAKYYEEWLREKDKLGTKWEGKDSNGVERQYVFHNGKGSPYYYQHPYKWWKRFCARHGIRFIKFHGLRHSSGTLLLEDENEGNFDSVLKAIQERLGHSRLSTTADIYVHLTKKVKKRTAGKYDKFARKNTPPMGAELGGELGAKTRLKRVK